jgi:hypothetical protein
MKKTTKKCSNEQKKKKKINYTSKGELSIKRMHQKNNEFDYRIKNQRNVKYIF